jgi:hypothetical protein
MCRKWEGGLWGDIEMATCTVARAGEDPHVAQDSAGVPHVSFPEGSTVAYLQRTGSGWTDPLILGSGEDPVIAIDDSDARYVIWEDQYRCTSDSGWEAARVFGGDASSTDAYGNGPYGHVVYRKNFRIWYVALSAGAEPPPPAHWLTLTSPNGGEVWVAGTSHTITWESSGNMPYVRIDWSTDGGHVWMKIASRTGNDGARDWTVPVNPSGRCRVRIQDKERSETQDTSDADFTIDAGGLSGGLSLSGADVAALFDLMQNFSNPFNPSTRIRFDIPGENESTTAVVLGVYDTRGRLVRNLLDDALAPGSYSLHWDGRSDAGDELSSGVYFLLIHAGTHRATMKMVLAR